MKAIAVRKNDRRGDVVAPRGIPDIEVHRHDLHTLIGDGVIDNKLQHAFLYLSTIQIDGGEHMQIISHMGKRALGFHNVKKWS